MIASVQARLTKQLGSCGTGAGGKQLLREARVGSGLKECPDDTDNKTPRLGSGDK
jgi:hypothetical protein